MKRCLPIALLLFLICWPGIYGQEKPNFIFILTDDQSYGLMGCTGNGIVGTPNLDRLAQDGILFTNAHITSAICTPSRMSILLSQFERRHGVNFNSGTSASKEAWTQSYPMVMRNAGYFTGWIGKNHAPVGPGGYDSGLMEKSFDYWYAGHGHLTFYPKERHEIFKNARSDTQIEIIGEGLNDFLDTNGQRLKGALRFLEARPKGRPFMLSLNFNLPHTAGTSSMEQREGDDEIYKSYYRDRQLPLPENYVAKKDISTPKLPGNLLMVENRQSSYAYVDTPEKVREIYTRQLQAMTGIDRLVGDLRQKLKTLELEKNTIIIFTSDHGLFMGEQGLGGKALCYEKTTHVPLILMDPRLPKRARGKRTDALVQSIDIAPTMLTMADIPIPDTFQGKSLSSLIHGGKKELRDFIFTENLWSTHFGNPRCEAVQDKEWKYIRYYKNNNFQVSKKMELAKQLGLDSSKFLYGVHDSDMLVYRDYIESPLQGEPPVHEELYNLREDPGELHNKAGRPEYAEILQKLRAAWALAIREARGTGDPQVLRYTVESRLEAKGAMTPK